jgi:hypothetical protein
VWFFASVTFPRSFLLEKRDMADQRYEGWGLSFIVQGTLSLEFKKVIRTKTKTYF